MMDRLDVHLATNLGTPVHRLSFRVELLQHGVSSNEILELHDFRVTVISTMHDVTARYLFILRSRTANYQEEHSTILHITIC